MASERVTRSGRKSPAYGRTIRSRSTGPLPYSRTEVNTPESNTQPTTSRTTTSINSRDFFPSEDEYSSNGEPTSESGRTIEDQKTPKPPKKAKRNTPPYPTQDTFSERIRDLPPPIFELDFVGQAKNLEKKELKLDMVTVKKL